MLNSLTVKNFALIKDANIDFKNNLNVLTGETGSGKSILIGSINLALGMRASKDVMRDENKDTIVNISFSIDDAELIKVFKDMDIDIDIDNKEIIVYRKITKDKNISKINDVPVTLNKIKEVTNRLIDIYGQHDGEDLRKNSKHIIFLDEYIGDKIKPYKEEIRKLYYELKEKKEKLSNFNLDEKIRLREIDILKYEIEELDNAKLKDGEEEELASAFKLASNSKDIVNSLYKVLSLLEETDLGKAIKLVNDSIKYDDTLTNVYDSLITCDSIINDSKKDIEKKVRSYDMDESEYKRIEERLSKIRAVLSKYNHSVENALKELDEKKERLNMLENYDIEKSKANKEYDAINIKLLDACKNLTKFRKNKAKSFVSDLIYELKDLGFLSVKFDIDFKEKNEPSLDGIDDITFMLSLNAGEKLRPLSDIASGGELSRIMLSIKTILSGASNDETLIFDEIDAGISGITASKVAKKLNKIAKNHQVILITHLPQIAAMADSHYVISKGVNDNRTETIVSELDYEGMINEIGRLISSSGSLTDKVLANAKELKEMASKEK